MSKMSSAMKRNIKQDLEIIIFGAILIIVVLQIPTNVIEYLLFGGSIGGLLLCGAFPAGKDDKEE